MHKIPGFILIAGLVIGLSACTFSLASDITPPPGSEQQPPQQVTPSVASSPVYPIVPPDLADGAQIYEQKCSECHGPRGLGDGPQASQLSVPVATLGLSDFARLFAPSDWYTVVTKGNMEQFMPAFTTLTDRQRWDVVAYAMNLSVTSEQLAQGEIFYQEDCASCHGQSGNGNGTSTSDLAKHPTDFTQQALMAQRSATSLYQTISSGIAPDMPAFADKLDENSRWILAAYLRSLTFTSSLASLNVYPAPQATTSSSSTVSYPPPTTYPAPVVTTLPFEVTPTTEISPTGVFTGSVSVQLINGSGGSAPSDSPVTLYGFDNMQNTYSETIKTGINGVYTFTNIRMPEGRVFLAGAKYASGSYGSDIATVDPKTPDLNLQITVFDTTTDLTPLTADRLHILFDFSQPKIAQVIEVFVISNPSRQAIISALPDGMVVTFPLPQGYSNLQFQDGELGGRYVAVDQGFADTSTVNPGVGGYTVIFAFDMPYDRKLEFSQPLSLPTSAVVVMVPDNGVKVVANQLQDGGTLDYQGISYHKYNGSGLLAGNSLAFTLTGNPNNSAAESAIFSPGNLQSLAIGLGVFGAAILVAGLWLYRRNRVRLAAQQSSGGTDIASAESGIDQVLDDEDTLMDAIIALDDQFNAGNLPEEVYLERRAVLKARLRNLDRG